MSDEKENLNIKDGKIFCPLLDAWHIATPEEKVRQEWVARLVNDYGYKLEQMAQEITVTNTLKSSGEKRGTGQARADIVVWKSKEEKHEGKKAFIVVELKAENVRIHEEDYYQGFNYAAWAGARFFVTSNQKETRFFNVDNEYLPKKLQEIVAIPTQEESLIENKVNQILNQTKAFNREEFTKVLQTCHNIIRNNDKLSPEAAFDEISKILFMKIRRERKERGVKVFTKKEYQEAVSSYEQDLRPGLKTKGLDQSYMQYLFDTTKDDFKADHLFDENDDIKIRENSFESILERLENYNLSDTQDDVKGIAFEKFLGTTFRGELGQFFTPRTIVDFMTEVLDPCEGEIICDPCCGSGGFLIKAFEYVREKIEKDIKQKEEELQEALEGSNLQEKSFEEQIKTSKQIEDMKNTLNEELLTDRETRMHYLSSSCIYGTDANPRMARTSKMNMIMHGDGHGGVHHHDGLLNVNGIFQERFDIILTNPPFGARVDRSLKISNVDKFTDEDLIKKYTAQYGEQYTKALEQVNSNIGSPVIDLYETGKLSSLTETLFMERCLSLLRKGGRMGMVLPEGVLNTSNLAKVREWMEGKAKIILIVSIPQDVFIAAGATVKPSLVFFKRFTKEEEEEYAACVKQAQEEKRKEKQCQIDTLQKEKNSLLESKKREDKTRVKQINKALEQIESDIIKEAKPRIKELFNYDIPIAQVHDAGITTTGQESKGNLLPALLKEFSDYRKSAHLWQNDGAIEYCYKITQEGKIERQEIAKKKTNFLRDTQGRTSYKILKFIQNKELDKWYVEYYLNKQDLKSMYEMKSLGFVIIPIKNKIKKNDYKGDLPVVEKIVFKTGEIVFRKENTTGMDLWKVGKGELIVSSINFHQGAVALNDKAECVCSTHYQIFSINTNLVTPEYLVMVLRSSKFINAVSGTKAQGIKNESGYDFIKQFAIPLPPIEVQTQLLEKYNRTLMEIQRLKQQLETDKKDFVNSIFN